MEIGKQNGVNFWDTLKDDLFQELENNQNMFSFSVITQAQQSIRLCADSLDKLRDYIIQYTFKDQKEEIDFFKKIKPAIYGRLLYFYKIYDIETAQPAGLGKEQLYKEVSRVMSFFKKHKFFYRYYRGEETYLDDKFFRRSTSAMPIQRRLFDSYYHPNFCTSHDNIFAEIIANELLIIYLEKPAQRITSTTQPHTITPTPIPSKKLTWTDPKSALIEMAYAYKAKGSFNNGKATLKEIFEYLQWVFDIVLTNPSRDFQEILRRKSGYTIYIDGLKEDYLKYVDEIQSRPHR
ncbi:MAG: hypothetical protein E6Q24_04805 [Chitinophagaceae bacterium]|nr:MAG: hypothetical protein E6Q24_04805 [Chitinophagaceae bacterium]